MFFYISVSVSLKSPNDTDGSADLFMRHRDCGTSSLDIFLTSFMIFTFFHYFNFIWFISVLSTDISVKFAAVILCYCVAELILFL